MEKLPVEEPEMLAEKKLLTRKSSGSISSPSSVTGSPHHHRSPRRAASERRRSRHHHQHHHHHERKGSLYSASSSHHGPDGRRTSRVADRRVSHALGEPLNIPSRTNSISEQHRKLSATDSSSLPVPQRKPSERQSSNGPYMSPGLNMAGGYRTPGAEILIASLIIAVGLVSLIVWGSTGQKNLADSRWCVFRLGGHVLDPRTMLVLCNGERETSGWSNGIKSSNQWGNSCQIASSSFIVC